MIRHMRHGSPPTHSASVYPQPQPSGIPDDPFSRRSYDYAVYDVLLPVGQRYAGKDKTHGIERDNARQRHWLARFRRRSIVVSKAKRMVDVSIALFARFAGNDRIGDLLSMLT